MSALLLKNLISLPSGDGPQSRVLAWTVNQVLYGGTPESYIPRTKGEDAAGIRTDAKTSG